MYSIHLILFFAHRKEVMPWLYYSDSVNQILKDISIPTSYNFPDDTLDIVLAEYSYNGTFLGYSDAVDGSLQRCPNNNQYLDAAWNFGTSYKQSVSREMLHFSHSSPPLPLSFRMPTHTHGQKARPPRQICVPIFYI